MVQNIIKIVIYSISYILNADVKVSQGQLFSRKLHSVNSVFRGILMKISYLTKTSDLRKILISNTISNSIKNERGSNILQEMSRRWHDWNIDHCSRCKQLTRHAYRLSEQKRIPRPGNTLVRQYSTIFISQIYTVVCTQPSCSCIFRTVCRRPASVCVRRDANAKVLHMCNVSRYTGDRGDTRWAGPREGETYWKEMADLLW